MSDPYFLKIAKEGRLLTNYHGNIHPSQPNYLAMIAGDHFNVTTDDDVVFNNTATIVDLFEKENITWGSYQEDYPKDQGCFTNSTAGGEGKYVRKHNPFMSFSSITNDPKRCARVFNSDQLYEDIEKKQLPKYVFYTPNLMDDGHDSNRKGDNFTYPSSWFEKFFEPLRKNPYMNGTTFLITFDEVYK